jgi:outer membrane protein assembly factor BamB
VAAKTGEQIWNERLPAGGSYYASPLFVDGRIYFFSDSGKTTVIKPAPRFEVLAVNSLIAGCMATPAVGGKAFYIRTKTHLYRIEK